LIVIPVNAKIHGAAGTVFIVHGAAGTVFIVHGAVGTVFMLAARHEQV
jgi:hypothetical protein